MKFTSAVLTSLVALVSASPAPQPDAALEARQSYGNCQVTGRGGLDGAGTCRRNAGGYCNGVSVQGFCPGLPGDIQCCRNIRCAAPYGANINACRNTYKGCGGVFVSGLCPGGSDVKCCAT